jgi:hypothetical protein
LGKKSQIIFEALPIKLCLSQPAQKKSGRKHSDAASRRSLVVSEKRINDQPCLKAGESLV